MTTTPNPVPGDLAAVQSAEAKAEADQKADDAVIDTDIAQAEKDEAAQTTPPPPPLTKTFGAFASGTSITVAWTNGAPSKVGRNGVDSGGFGAWDTSMASPVPVLAATDTWAFTGLVPGTLYTLTATYPDGSTLSATATVPATVVTPPPPPPSGLACSLPASYGATTLLKRIDLVNLPAAQVARNWYGKDGAIQNGTPMDSSHVLPNTAFDDGSVGTRFTLSGGIGGIISTYPPGGANPGITVAPTATTAVYVQHRRKQPATSGGAVADWGESLWLTGGDSKQSWEDEIDADEGLSGTDQGHIHWNQGSISGSAGFSIDDTGWHTIGVLWEVGKVTWIYDGKQAGNVVPVPTTADPMGIISGLSLPVQAGVDLVEPANLDVSDISVWTVAV